MPTESAVPSSVSGEMTDRSPDSSGLPLVAITGANGYLGSLLVTAFEAAGFSVRRLVRNPRPATDDRRFDLGGLNATDILEGVDVLVHCAYDMTLTKREQIWQTNVFGSTSLFDMALPCVKRTIAVSSMSAYAGTGQLYGRAKLDMEKAALSRGMVVVRPGLVYGPGSGGMAGTLRRLASLPVLPDFGPDANQFTVHQEDLAAAVVALALAETPALVPIGIAHPDPVRFKTLLTHLAADNGSNRGPRFVPTPPMAAYTALRLAELLPVGLPVRADSLLGLVRPAPGVPNVTAIESLGVTLRPFPEGLSGLEE